MYRVVAKPKGKNERYTSVTTGGDNRVKYFKTKREAESYASALHSFDSKVVKKKSVQRKQSNSFFGLRY